MAPIRAEVTNAEAVYNAAAPTQRDRLRRLIADLERDATPDGYIARPPVFFAAKTMNGFDVVYYVLDLSRTPQPIRISHIKEIEAGSPERNPPARPR